MVARYIKFGIKSILVLCIKFFILFIPKKKNLICFSAWFGEKYLDNPRYFYEYLKTHHSDEFDVCWLTYNNEVYKSMSKFGHNVKKLDSFSGIWSQIRAKYLVCCIQISDFQRYFLVNCKILDLNHGHPIKDPGLSYRDKFTVLEKKLFLVGVKYCTIVCSKFAGEQHSLVIPVKSENIYLGNYCRNDIFKNPIVVYNKFIEEIKNGRKAIVYMPTHRSDGKKKMNMSEILDLNRIEEICKEHDCIFLIKKHFYHRGEAEDFSTYEHIFDVTSYDLDPQELLWQADILISDYSACYIDYLLLDRPIVFYHFDSEQFQKQERTFLVPFHKNPAAPQISNKGDLCDYLYSITMNWDDNYQNGRNQMKRFYFESNIEELGCEQAYKILKTI